MYALKDPVGDSCGQALRVESPEKVGDGNREGDAPATEETWRSCLSRVANEKGDDEERETEVRDEKCRTRRATGHTSRHGTEAIEKAKRGS